MMSLRKIKLTSAGTKQSSVNNVKIVPADSKNSSFKRIYNVLITLNAKPHP